MTVPDARARTQRSNDGAVQLTPQQLVELTDRLPRARLSVWPTPLVECTRLGERLGVRIRMKREDLSTLAFGGNKVRNLEFRMGRAKALGCDTIVLARDQNSNNARLTAAAAAATGLELVLLVPSDVQPLVVGNRLVQEILGVTVIEIPGSTPDEIKKATAEVVRERTDAGHRVYENDAEQADAIAVLGWVRAAAELFEQCGDAGFEPAAIYMPAGFSQAGLSLGAHLLGWKTRIVGVANLFGSTQLDVKQRAAMSEVCEMLGISDVVSDVELNVRDDLLGNALIEMQPAARSAAYLVGETEGVVIDPYYNGRAVAVMAHDAREIWKEGDELVYIHTGGTPMVFASPELLRREPSDPTW